MLLLLPALSQAQQLVVTINGTNATCAGLNNGSATAVVTGRWFPFTYLRSNGATTETITNLSPGTYCVTVTDIDLAVDSECINIGEPTPLNVTVSCQSQICGLVPDGMAQAVPNGGTPPYSYLWSNGDITPGILDLS